MKLREKPIAITLGEPAGIGADCVIEIASRFPELSCVVIGSESLLLARAEKLKCKIHFNRYSSSQSWPPSTPGMSILPVELAVQVNCGVLALDNVPYVLKCLEIAASGCLQGQFHAMVTGPVQKSLIEQAGIAFSGHTEWIANYLQHQLKNNLVNEEIWPVMLLTHEQLRVALVTTHMPLSQVPLAITSERLSRTLRVIFHDLKNRFNIDEPRVLVCGLNPHAGEAGHLGREEIDVIIPTLELFRQQGYQVVGPVPADTAFVPEFLEDIDLVLAMYHDQGLPVIKSYGFDDAVNVTLGLPIIRTSVDHGTALSLAGTGKAKYGSLLAAIQLANQLQNYSF